MLSILDNLDNYNIHSINCFDQDNNENPLNIINEKYYPLELNYIEHNNKNEEASAKGYNLISKKLNRNNILENRNEILSNKLENKNKKIFNIQKISIHSNNKKENKVKEIFSISNDDFDMNIKKIKEESLNNLEKNKKNKIINNIKSKFSFIDNPKPLNKSLKHDKFTDDNLRKKCKHLVLDSVMEFMNKKIYSLYNGNIGNNIYRKEILTLNKSQKSKANIIYDREFINKKISDIFSDNISSRYTNFVPEHNKLLIESLRNEEDENKRIFFNKLFNLTFKDCLEHYIGKKQREELEGMKCFDSEKDLLSEDNEYINIIKYYLENYENIINKKNPRKPKRNIKTEHVEEEKRDL